MGARDAEGEASRWLSAHGGQRAAATTSSASHLLHQHWLSRPGRSPLTPRGADPGRFLGALPRPKRIRIREEHRLPIKAKPAAPPYPPTPNLGRARGLDPRRDVQRREPTSTTGSRVRQRPGGIGAAAERGRPGRARDGEPVRFERGPAGAAIKRAETTHAFEGVPAGERHRAAGIGVGIRQPLVEKPAFRHQEPRRVRGRRGWSCWGKARYGPSCSS